MEITYELEKEDIIEARWHRIVVNPPKAYLNLYRFTLGFFIALAVYQLLLDSQQYPLVNKIARSIVVIVIYLLGWQVLRRVSSWYIIRQNLPQSGVICQHTITLTETKLIEKTDVGREHATWEGMEGVEEIDDYILIFISSEKYHIIPKRAFESTSECDAFYEFVKNKVPQKN